MDRFECLAPRTSHFCAMHTAGEGDKQSACNLVRTQRPRRWENPMLMIKAAVLQPICHPHRTQNGTPEPFPGILYYRVWCLCSAVLLVAGLSRDLVRCPKATEN